jgi:hypothetical protein
MKSDNIKNSCGSQGCDVDRIILPHDSGVGSVSSRVLPERNDIPSVLRLFDTSIREEQRKAA